MAEVVEAIITSRNFSISGSSSSRSCNNRTISICIFTLSPLKISNSNDGDNSKNTFKYF